MDILDILSNLETELVDTYNNSKPTKEETKVDNKDARIKELEKQRDDICIAARKLISDFDRANNRLVALIKENEELKEKVKNLQENYIDTTTMGRQNTAYGRAFGEILGAIERCKKDL